MSATTFNKVRSVEPRKMILARVIKGETLSVPDSSNYLITSRSSDYAYFYLHLFPMKFDETFNFYKTQLKNNES